MWCSIISSTCDRGCTIEVLAEMGGIPKPMTPAEFGKLIADETDKWRKVVEFAGVSVD